MEAEGWKAESQGGDRREGWKAGKRGGGEAGRLGGGRRLKAEGLEGWKARLGL
jgi:hypothetical protein